MNRLPVNRQYTFSAISLAPSALGWTVSGNNSGWRLRAPYPASGVFLAMVALAVGERVGVAGIDLYAHPGRRQYAADEQATSPHQWPSRHSMDCDVNHLRRALAKITYRVRMTHPIQRLLDEKPG